MINRFNGGLRPRRWQRDRAAELELLALLDADERSTSREMGDGNRRLEQFPSLFDDQRIDDRGRAARPSSTEER